MLYVALATDYDGTLAHDGQVASATVDALKRLAAAGKRLIMVTGRDLPSLKQACPALDVFDVVVVENGALLYFPKTHEERPIAPAPPPEFVERLTQMNVEPLSIGRSIVATWTPHESEVLQAIRELGLDWQIIFNKGAVMCLPPGINKASGLRAALDDLKISPLNVIATGDAENDQSFLSICGCAVAVANALDSVKAAADITTTADHGAGVAELIGRWLTDPAITFGGLTRHDIVLGEDSSDGSTVMIPGKPGALLISGSSGAGKSRLTTLIMERLIANEYQVLVVDPEGDYDKLDKFAHLGDSKRTPPIDEVVNLLDTPATNVVVNLLGTEVNERPDYFNKLMGRLSGLRTGTGRPQWLILDEAHHLTPRGKEPTGIPSDLGSSLFITTSPEHLSRSALLATTGLVAVGPKASEVLQRYTEAVGRRPLRVPDLPPGDEQVWYWDGNASHAVRVIKIAQPIQFHQRHTRKYAEGRLGEDKSFFFRGPHAALNLRAYNLGTFLELSKGVDDATWMYHLKRGDYMRWFRDAINDEDLAQAAAAIESQHDPLKSRQAMAEVIKQRYAVMGPD